MTRVQELKKQIAELHKDWQTNTRDYAKMKAIGNLREEARLKEARIAILESIAWRQQQIIMFTEADVEFGVLKAR